VSEDPPDRGRTYTVPEAAQFTGFAVAPTRVVSRHLLDQPGERKHRSACGPGKTVLGKHRQPPFDTVTDAGGPRGSRGAMIVSICFTPVGVACAQLATGPTTLMRFATL